MSRPKLSLALAMACVICAATAPGAFATTSANPVSATEGQTFSGVVGSYTNCSGSESASIDWGDGQSSPATLGPPQGGATCSISAAHPYAEELSTKTTVTVTGAVGGPPTSSATSTATVGDSPLAVSGQTLAGTPGQPVGGVVAIFTDSGGPEPNGSYGATINWGDGQSSPATVNAGQISASHTYAAPGHFSVTVSVSDEGGANGGAISTVVVHACPSLSNTAAPAFVPGAGTPNQRYLQALYHDLLGRPPSGVEVTYWAGALSLGVTRSQVALALASSGEHRSGLTSALYQAYLRRSPTAADVSFAQSVLALATGDKLLPAELLGSNEYLAGQGGGVQSGFVTALYCDVLHRPPDPAGQLFAAQLLSGGGTRQQVAQALLASQEYRQGLVASWYLRYLRRMADASGLTALSAALAHGASDEQVLASIVSSDEYFHLFTQGSGLASPAVNARGVITLILHRAATLRLVVLRVIRPGTPAPQIPHIAAVLGSPSLRAPKVRRLGIASLGRHRAGRVSVRWNRTVGGHKLVPGRYLLMLQARVGKRQTDVSDAIPFTQR